MSDNEQSGRQGLGASLRAQSCEHRFVYGGLRYADGAYNRPGSGAKNTYYGHAYHCEKCLDPRVEAISQGDRNSYQDRLPSSAPATGAERALLVPKHDQEWGRF